MPGILLEMKDLWYLRWKLLQSRNIYLLQLLYSATLPLKHPRGCLCIIFGEQKGEGTSAVIMEREDLKSALKYYYSCSVFYVAKQLWISGAFVSRVSRRKIFFWKHAGSNTLYFHSSHRMHLLLILHVWEQPQHMRTPPLGGEISWTMGRNIGKIQYAGAVGYISSSGVPSCIVILFLCLFVDHPGGHCEKQDARLDGLLVPSSKLLPNGTGTGWWCNKYCRCHITPCKRPRNMQTFLSLLRIGSNGKREGSLTWHFVAPAVLTCCHSL